MPSKKQTGKPLYRAKRKPRTDARPPADDILRHAAPVAPAHFQLADDGSIVVREEPAAVGRLCQTAGDGLSATPAVSQKRPTTAPPRLAYHDAARGLWLYHGNSLELLDAIADRYPEGRFDCIFADPPYFLSNGGITCHAGRMVSVHKGDWDQSRGPELNHEFNLEWLRRCQRVLRPDGTIWVTGTLHVIFSVGYAMQQLGFKLLNDIAWEKPNPPPNLSCRYFTHSTETVLWAAKSAKSKHRFNYADMKAVTGKQMKTVWKIGAPSGGEKTFGKHPTQKPVALVERCLLASTAPGDLVLDPFLGGGTTAVACVRLRRGFIGVEMDIAHLALSGRRVDREIIELWLREFRVRVDVEIIGSNDLDQIPLPMDRIAPMANEPQVQTDCIFHETKFVFLSCAKVEHAAVVHTTVDVSITEAWCKAPQTTKRQTTHIVRCETEILRVKS